MEEAETEAKNKIERDILWLFDIGLVLKAVNGVIEIVSAFVVAFISPALVLRLVDFATAGELTEDRADLISQFLRSIANAFSVSNHFLIALYLLVHGLIKVALVVGIFSGKRIAYPLFMVALAFFGSYEIYLGIIRHSFLLETLGFFDSMLIILTWYEYRRRYSGNLSLRDMREDYAGRLERERRERQ